MIVRYLILYKRKVINCKERIKDEHLVHTSFCTASEQGSDVWMWLESLHDVQFFLKTSKFILRVVIFNQTTDQSCILINFVARELNLKIRILN